jgi:hypothetical protein
MDLKEIQRQLDMMMHEQNNRPIPEFEGYSPFEMHHLMNFTYGPNSPVQIKRLPEQDYINIPMFNLIKYLLDLIARNGEIKLTNKGHLPTRIVAELYSLGFFREEHIESGMVKLYKETDTLSVQLTRILTEMAGLAKKRHGKLSLTKTGENTLQDHVELFRLILETFGSKFNWAYFDGYGNNNIGQLGYGFSLILLSRYGREKRPDTFYAQKYFKAYPDLLKSIVPAFGTVERYAFRCYSLRTFERFLVCLGLISIEKSGPTWDAEIRITKTELFDKLIHCKPHLKYNLLDR